MSRLTIGVAGILIFAGACAGGPSGPPGGAVSRVEITAPAHSLKVGQSFALAAVAKGERGEVLAGRPGQWRSESPAVATVTPEGIVTAVGPGSARILVEIDGVEGLVVLTVWQEPVVSVDIFRPSSFVVVGHSLHLSAIPRAYDGGTLARRATAWVSSDTTLATVSAEGVVTGISPGDVWITVVVEGVAHSVPLRVEAERPASISINSPGPMLIGTSRQFEAFIRGISGDVLFHWASPSLEWMPSWSSSNPSVASVTSQGVVTGHALGTARITASIQGLSYSVTAWINPTAVRVSPTAVSLPVGSTSQLQAVALDSRGEPLAGPMTWRTSDPKVATVDGNGLVRAIGVGTATITAESVLVQGTATVTVP